MDFTTKDLRELFAQLASRMTEERDNLCILDGAVGDGDHGIAMELGFNAASKAVADSPGNLQDLFTAAAKGFLNAVGASSGPLYGTALLRAAKVAGPRDAMPRSEVALLIAAMRDGIAQRGKAAPGDKTMLDAWEPAAVAATLGASALEITEAAWKGADSTKEMVASIGRAERLGARSLGHVDPGAVSAAYVVSMVCRWAE